MIQNWAIWATQKWWRHTIHSYLPLLHRIIFEYIWTSKSLINVLGWTEIKVITHVHIPLGPACQKVCSLNSYCKPQSNTIQILEIWQKQESSLALACFVLYVAGCTWHSKYYVREDSRRQWRSHYQQLSAEEVKKKVLVPILGLTWGFCAASSRDIAVRSKEEEKCECLKYLLPNVFASEFEASVLHHFSHWALVESYSY